MAARAPLSEGSRLGIDSLIVSIKAVFDTLQTQGRRSTYELRVDDHVVILNLADGALDARRGNVPSPDAVITTNHDALVEITAHRGHSGRPDTLLLSTLGRRTGQVRATPVFYLRDGADLVVCNVRPPGERTNPWPQNLDHQPAVEVTVEGRRRPVTARRATEEEVERLWPRLIRIWPLYADYYRHAKERHVFVLTPRSDAEDSG